MKNETELTVQDYKSANIEVSFLLNMLSQTITHVIGKASGVVGITAGRETAKKIPVFFDNPDISDITKEIEHYLKGGFDLKFKEMENGYQLNVNRCEIRNVCNREGIEIGKDLCSYFHNYINGMIVEFTKKKLQVKTEQTGEKCVINYLTI
jgi:hypothetical protein